MRARVSIATNAAERLCLFASITGCFTVARRVVEFDSFGRQSASRNSVTTNTMKLFRILILASLSAATVFGADQPSMAITNWQRVDFPRLSFSIPPGMTNVPVRGIDTQVGRYASTNMSLFFQFVRISGMEPNEPSTPVQVGGLAAKMVIRPLGSDESPWERAAGNTNCVVLAVPNVVSGPGYRTRKRPRA